MASSDITLLIAASALFVTGCVVSPDTEAETAATAAPASATHVPLARKVVRAPDGSLRVPFLGGAFVTYNREMPVEVEQAIAGIPTDRPVIVWAGLDRPAPVQGAEKR
jgi:hypothetical protein